MATFNLIATVIAVVGEAFARNSDGEIRVLRAGDVLYEGDTLVTRTGSEVELQTVDGARYELRKPTVLLVTNDFLTGDGPLVDETELDASTLDIFEREFGSDGLFSFRESDSGAEALLSDSFSEGHNFYRLPRILEPLSPLSFDTSTDLSRDLPIFDPGVSQDLPADEETVEPDEIELREFTVVNIFSNSAQVAEGESAVYTISIDKPSSQDVLVNLAYSGTATNGEDYVGVTSVIVPAGQTSVQFNVNTLEDGIFEGDESIIITITVAVGINVDIGQSVAEIDITLEESLDPPVVSIESLQPVVVEGGVARFNVSIDTPADEDITVVFSYSGVAVDGSDFTGKVDIVIPAGSTSAVLELPTNNDGLTEGRESLVVNIASVSGADSEISSQGSAATSIDDAPSLAVAGVSVEEGLAPYAVFTVSLSAVSAVNTTVALSLNAGSAVAGSDYTNSIEVSTDGGITWVFAGQASIPAGSLSVLARVAIIDDAVAEPVENFSLLASVIEGTIANSSASGLATITDSDAAFITVFAVINGPANVTEGDTTTSYTVSLIDAAGNPVVVSSDTDFVVVFANGSADAVD
jgi:hypothetical protein